MLNTLGCDCKINLARNKGLSSFPDSKEYYAKDCFRLCISTWYLSKLVSLGFSPKRLLLTNFKQGNRNATRYIKIKNIVCENKLSDTYCFNEGKKHRGVFNGIITGQCSEIIQYSSPDEVSTCNLASISLPKFVKNVGEYDFELLKEVAYKIVYNMNRVIDHNYYPVPEARKSNMRHRPVGVGVQGLADTFILMRYPFDSEEARKLNYNIFEAIYYGCLRASCDLAKTEGQYETFKGSPYSEGLFQFDLWGNSEVVKSSKWDWESLRNDIKNYGLRNSLLTAVMPTASTSQILGNTEAIEPIQSNIFTRTTLSGEFIVVNKYLVKDLQKIGLWNNEMKDRIIYHQGSVQQIPEIPDNIKKLYKTVWEISQRVLIDMSADRSLFIDQSQSLNLFVEKPSIGKLTSMHFYAYKKGLKTGCYYLRSKAARNAVQFTIDPSIEKREQKTQSQEKSHPQPPQPQEPPQESPVLACSLENPDCEMCSG
jgi:ribonucleoside-diphosphate reductase alpha chain